MSLGTPSTPKGRLRSDKWYDPKRDPPDQIWADHFTQQEWSEHVSVCEGFSQPQIRGSLNQQHESITASFKRRKDLQSLEEHEHFLQDLKKKYAVVSLFKSFIRDPNDDDNKTLEDIS